MSNERKSALVTGGSRGIGRAITLELAANGYHVYVNFRSNQAEAEKTLELIKSAGGEGELLPFDVTDEEAAGRSVEKIHSDRDSLDLLVNNAGVSADGLFAMMPGEEWDRVINVSLRGFYNCTRPVLKGMIRRKRGSIITISSISGLTGNRGQANYSAAKAGLIGASRSVATEVARLGIRVNVIAPGLIDTEMIADAPVDEIRKMIPMGRIGQPEEVARVALFLASEQASYITGQTISVNGGML